MPPRWFISQIYVSEADEKVAHKLDLRKNKKGGVTVSVAKRGGWVESFKLAKKVGKWRAWSCEGCIDFWNLNIFLLFDFGKNPDLELDVNKYIVFRYHHGGILPGKASRKCWRCCTRGSAPLVFRHRFWELLSVHIHLAPSYLAVLIERGWKKHKVANLDHKATPELGKTALPWILCDHTIIMKHLAKKVLV